MVSDHIPAVLDNAETPNETVSSKEMESSKSNDRNKFNRTVPKLMRSSTISIEGAFGKYHEDLHDHKRKMDEVESEFRNQKKIKDSSIIDQYISDGDVSMNESIVFKPVNDNLKPSVSANNTHPPISSKLKNPTANLPTQKELKLVDASISSTVEKSSSDISPRIDTAMKVDAQDVSIVKGKSSNSCLEEEGFSLAQIRKDLAAKRTMAKLAKPEPTKLTFVDGQQKVTELKPIQDSLSVRTQLPSIDPSTMERQNKTTKAVTQGTGANSKRIVTVAAEKDDSQTNALSDRDSMIIDDNMSRPLFNSLSPIAPKQFTSIDTNLSDDDMILDADMSIDFPSANNISKESRIAGITRTQESKLAGDSQSLGTPKVITTSQSSLLTLNSHPKFPQPVRKLELPVKTTMNIYKGTASSFLPPKEPVLVEPKSGISSFVTQQAKTVVKPKPPPVKALQQAALAAKREAEEKQKKLQQKEERMKLLQKKEEKKGILKKTVELAKPEVSTKMAAEKSKLDEPLKKKIGPPLLTTKPVANGIPTLKEKPKLPVYLDKTKQLISKLNPALPPKALEKEANPTIVDPEGDLPDIPSSEEESESDMDTPRKQKIPKWAQTPYLKDHLSRQETVNPDNIFDEISTPNIKDMMDSRIKMRESMFMSANERMDDLTAEEMREYRINMGFE
ncbi:hypothetical protein HDV01_005917 [Terramyces sp. JEL0728]|nr:hypothetical protein HDV01_005917 [Terramyces sp. JEL0728]